MRREAIGFLEMRHENIEAGKDRERLRREFHDLDPLYKIWYAASADPARPPTRYGIAGGLREYHIMWLLINDRKARDRDERKALPIERGRCADPPLSISYPYGLHLKMIIAGRKPDEIEPEASVRARRDDLGRHGARHLIMSDPGLRITG